MRSVQALRRCGWLLPLAVQRRRSPLLRPWLEREERERAERTDLLVRALQLRPGMVVADIGAGTGYLSTRIAPAVMPAGRILAVDMQQQMVRLLQQAVRQSGLLPPRRPASGRREGRPGRD